MYIQGAYDTRWNNDVLNPAFSALHASDFEVVQLGWKPPVTTVTGALNFYTVSPCRILDTRSAFGPFGGPALTTASQRILPTTGLCGIPVTAKALALNVTVVTAPAIGVVSLFPGDGLPGVSTSISFGVGQTRGNNAIAKLSSSGSGTIGMVSTTGPVNVILDVTGYFQ
jgi:hypothetical protein